MSRMKKFKLSSVLFALSLGGFSVAHAAPPEAGIALPQAVEMAFAQAPERALPAGREAQAQALARHAEALLPQAPNLNLSSQLGRYDPSQPTGTYSEWIGGVELPLWRPGQSEVLRRLAAGTQDLAEAERAALRLDLAGLLREAGWDVLMNQTRVQALQRGLHELQQAENKVQRQVALGERARVDAVMLSAELRDVQQQAAAAQQALEQARLVWRTLSRQELLPGKDWKEALSGERPLEQHPATLAAQARFSRAGQERQAGVLAAEGAPVLGVAARQDRTPGAETLNAVVMTLAVPLPWTAARGAAEAPLRYAELEAEVALAKQLRDVRLAREQARLALQSAREQAVLLAERAKAEQEGLRLAAKQVDEGLLDALAYVTVLRRAREAMLAAELGAMEVERAIARVNQAEGVI